MPLPTVVRSRGASAVGLLDWLMDKSVLPGYSRIGYAARRHWWPADAAAACLRGRTVVVTGASSGLGLAAASGLAQLGARVLLNGRSEQRLHRARLEILAIVPDALVEPAPGDVSELADVRRLAEALLDRAGSVHAVVHNAGVLSPVRTVTAEGHELSYATHVLGPHLLTHLLRPALRADGDARVLWMSSGGMYAQPLRSDDPEFRSGRYSGLGAYARTKRMQVAMSALWAERLQPEGVCSHSLHPGWADTPGVLDSLPGFRSTLGPLLRSPAQGADTAVWLAAAPAGGRRSGLFWQDRAPRPTAFAPWLRETTAQREDLWRHVVAATGAPP